MKNATGYHGETSNYNWWASLCSCNYIFVLQTAGITFTNVLPLLSYACICEIKGHIIQWNIPANAQVNRESMFIPLLYINLYNRSVLKENWVHSVCHSSHYNTVAGEVRPKCLGIQKNPMLSGPNFGLFVKDPSTKLDTEYYWHISCIFPSPGKYTLKQDLTTSIMKQAHGVITIKKDQQECAAE